MQKTSAELWSPVKDKNWINKWLNLRISILFQYFMHVLDKHFSKVLKTDFTIQYFFNTAWEPWIKC